MCIANSLLAFDSKASGTLEVTLNSHRELCGVHKPGGVPIVPEQMAECLRIAAAKATELSAALTQALQADQARREAGTWRRGVDVLSLAEMSRQRAMNSGGVASDKSISEVTTTIPATDAAEAGSVSAEEVATVTSVEKKGTSGPFEGGHSTWDKT